MENEEVKTTETMEENSAPVENIMVADEETKEEEVTSPEMPTEEVSA